MLSRRYSVLFVAMICLILIAFALNFSMLKSRTRRKSVSVDEITFPPPDLRRKQFEPRSFSTKQWITVYIMSAFFDDRRGNDANHHVRIVAVRDSRATDNLEFQCIYSTHDGVTMGVSQASIVPSNAGAYFDGKTFIPIIVSCKVQNQKPFFVTLLPKLSRSQLHQVKNSKLVFDSTFGAKIQYPEKPKHQKTIINCVSVTFGRPNSTRLVEWLELLRILGMDRVEIHDLNIHKDPRRVLESYTSSAGDGLVELVTTPALSDSVLGFFPLMTFAINNCMYRNMYKYRYMAVFDVDEVIFPRLDDSYAAMMQRLFTEQRKSGNISPVIDFSFTNVYFFLDIPGSIDNTKRTTLTRQIKHVKPSPIGYSAKSIIDPRGCVAMQNHYCWTRVTFPVKEEFKNKTSLNSISTSLDVGANQHYKQCHFDVKECKMMMKNIYENRSMQRFEKILSERVMNKLRQLNIKHS